MLNKLYGVKGIPQSRLIKNNILFLQIICVFNYVAPQEQNPESFKKLHSMVKVAPVYITRTSSTMKQPGPPLDFWTQSGETSDFIKNSTKLKVKRNRKESRRPIDTDKRRELGMFGSVHKNSTTEQPNGENLKPNSELKSGFNYPKIWVSPLNVILKSSDERTKLKKTLKEPILLNEIRNKKFPHIDKHHLEKESNYKKGSAPKDLTTGATVPSHHTHKLKTTPKSKQYIGQLDPTRNSELQLFGRTLGDQSHKLYEKDLETLKDGEVRVPKRTRPIIVQHHAFKGMGRNIQIISPRGIAVAAKVTQVKSIKMNKSGSENMHEAVINQHENDKISFLKQIPEVNDKNSKNVTYLDKVRQYSHKPMGKLNLLTDDKAELGQQNEKNKQSKINLPRNENYELFYQAQNKANNTVESIVLQKIGEVESNDRRIEQTNLSLYTSERKLEEAQNYSDSFQIKDQTDLAKNITTDISNNAYEIITENYIPGLNKARQENGDMRNKIIRKENVGQQILQSQMVDIGSINNHNRAEENQNFHDHAAFIRDSDQVNQEFDKLRNNVINVPRHENVDVRQNIFHNAQVSMENPQTHNDNSATIADSTILKQEIENITSEFNVSRHENLGTHNQISHVKSEKSGNFAKILQMPSINENFESDGKLAGFDIEEPEVDFLKAENTTKVNIDTDYKVLNNVVENNTLRDEIVAVRNEIRLLKADFIANMQQMRTKMKSTLKMLTTLLRGLNDFKRETLQTLSDLSTKVDRSRSHAPFDTSASSNKNVAVSNIYSASGDNIKPSYMFPNHDKNLRDQYMKPANVYNVLNPYKYLSPVSTSSIPLSSISPDLFMNPVGKLTTPQILNPLHQLPSLSSNIPSSQNDYINVPHQLDPQILRDGWQRHDNSMGNAPEAAVILGNNNSLPNFEVPPNKYAYHLPSMGSSGNNLLDEYKRNLVLFGENISTLPSYYDGRALLTSNLNSPSIYPNMPIPTFKTPMNGAETSPEFRANPAPSAVYPFLTGNMNFPNIDGRNSQTFFTPPMENIESLLQNYPKTKKEYLTERMEKYKDLSNLNTVDDFKNKSLPDAAVLVRKNDNETKMHSDISDNSLINSKIVEQHPRNITYIEKVIQSIDHVRSTKHAQHTHHHKATHAHSANHSLTHLHSNKHGISNVRRTNGTIRHIHRENNQAMLGRQGNNTYKENHTTVYSQAVSNTKPANKAKILQSEIESQLKNHQQFNITNMPLNIRKFPTDAISSGINDTTSEKNKLGTDVTDSNIGNFREASRPPGKHEKVDTQVIRKLEFDNNTSIKAKESLPELNANLGTMVVRL